MWISMLSLLIGTGLAKAGPPQVSAVLGDFFAESVVLEGPAATAGEYGGMAVVDVDDDLHFELFVSGQRQKNRVLKWMTGAFVDIAHTVGLDDHPLREGLGVSVCDTDGDGVEEIYAISSSHAPGQRVEQGIRGARQFSDHLYTRGVNDSVYKDSLSWTSNKRQTLAAARVAACVDSEGSGVYDLYVGELGGGLRLLNPRSGEYTYAIDAPVAPSPKPGVPKVNASMRTPPQSFQAMVACPFGTGSANTDLFCANSAGSNHLLMNKKSAFYAMDNLIPLVGPARDPTTFEDKTRKPLDDLKGLARAVAVLDEDGDGNMDLLVGNSEPASDFAIDSTGIKKPVELAGHHFFAALGNGLFEDKTFKALRSNPSRVRGIVVADFDNDGQEEIFFHNSATTMEQQPNVLLQKVGGNWTSVPLGPASEPTMMGTGAVVMDMDNDGKLELILSHGDGVATPLTIYRSANGKTHSYLRVLPLTPFGAPARGATVTLTELCGRRQMRVIDGGGTQLAQHEPIAHFGLAAHKAVLEIRVTWADGRRFIMLNPRLNRLHRIEYPPHDKIDNARGNAKKPTEQECTGLWGPGIGFKPRVPPKPRETPAQSIPRVPFVVPVLDCYNGTGLSYRGEVARTISGAKCQPWANQYPNFHSYLPVWYPNSGLKRNFCRNPSNAETEPWCFTVDGNRSEVCGIDKCPQRPMSGRAMFEASIMSEADATECVDSPSCMTYEMQTCPARDIQAACREGMIFQRVRAKDGSERCFCRKGKTVPCGANPLDLTAANASHLCGNRTVLEKIVTPGGTRCACMEYSSTQGILGGLFSDQQVWRAKAPISVRAQVAFRNCLKENAAGPLRCIAVMEKLGFPFASYGSASISGKQEAWDEADREARALAEREAQERKEQNEQHDKDEQDDQENDEDGFAALGENAQKEIEVVMNCDEVPEPAPENNSSAPINPCADPNSLFIRKITDGAEVCTCRRGSYSIPCTPTNMNDVCMDGYTVAMASGSHCTCTDERSQRGDLDDMFVSGEWWHKGCEQCHYGNGKCMFDKEIGYYCRCHQGYEGPDCMAIPTAMGALQT